VAHRWRQQNSGLTLASVFATFVEVSVKTTPELPVTRLIPAPRIPLSAHAWTIGPNLLARIAPRAAPSHRAWSVELDDPQIGRVRLRGALQSGQGDTCLMVVHGLGGSFERAYCVQAAWAAQRANLPCLRLGLRGADRSGEDFYHGGLIADLDAALTSPELARFERVVVIGYSLGGHVTLRYALEARQPRLAAVAAICAPLDLELGAQCLDSRSSAIYRRHVLSGLKEMYSAVAQRKAVPTPLSRVSQARTLREWDTLTVVPRFGFGSAENYYESMSVGPRLSKLAVPALLVQSQHDPMVPPWTYERHLAKASDKLEIKTLGQGGHVAFPKVKLHPHAQPGVLEDQVIAWLMQRLD
jgi:predicted alpha/beta-fold hydrolase